MKRHPDVFGAEDLTLLVEPQDIPMRASMTPEPRMLHHSVRSGSGGLGLGRLGLGRVGRVGVEGPVEIPAVLWNRGDHAD